jgi:hypothetical protein
MTVLGTLPTKPKITVNPVVILRILQAFAVLIFLVLVYGIFVISSKYKSLDALTSSLHLTSIYPDAKNAIRTSISTASSDQKNQFLKSLQQKENIADVIALNKTAEAQYTQTQNYIDAIQKPYENLLHYYLLPPLNIWKNRFTGKIDDTLIWQKYLKNNTYLDVNLINKRTNFFKDIGGDSPKIDIKDITVWKILENAANGTFTIGIEVTFVAQTKRSFLLLVDKLSTTSNKENLWLMNEFFYNLWTVLKERDAGAAWSVSSWWVLLTSSTWDEKLWIDIYKRVVDPSSSYIKDQDIIKTIRRFANCEWDDMGECYFKFREKMRNLPSLAYTIWLPNTNKSNELRLFMQNMSPLIKVKWFTFTKQSSTNNREENRSYEWTISIEAYWKSMSSAEVDEIGTYLWAICLADGSALSPWWALNQLERTIKQATQISQFSNEKSKQLNDLREAINQINAVYGWLPWLQRVVSLFELYRMLLDNGLCTPKK